MLFSLFSAVIYLPTIVACMIISQIYFERYWVSYNNVNYTNHWLMLAIVITYFMQEFCLLQLSVQNINEVGFTLVVALTMIFRDKVYKIWWWLLGITPLFVDFVEINMHRWPTYYWWHGIIQSAVFLLICWLLSKWKPSYPRMRYYASIVCLGVFELIILVLQHRVTTVRVAAATVGLLVIVLIEEQRHISESYNIQKLKMLRRNSERDDLTGLLNYRALSQEVTSLDHGDNINQIVIGALDIDHFKHVNDTYGHFVGNEVLNYFSTIFMNRKSIPLFLTVVTSIVSVARNFPSWFPTIHCKRSMMF